MEKIALAELKERQQISSLDEYTDMDLSHEEDYNRFKDIFPKSVEAIEKLPTDKIYVNTEDLQGDDFAFYRYGSLRAWAYQALVWAFTDDYDEEAEPDENLIQAIDDLTFAINAAIKVWTSDDMRTDLDYINAPYYKNGDVIDIGVSISKNEDYDKLAEYFLKEYEGLKDLEIRDDGLIISSKPLKTFYISVTETLNRIVEVHAEDKYEAIQKATDAYCDGQVVLDSDDYVEVDFSDETEETINNYELGGMPKFYEVQ